MDGEERGCSLLAEPGGTGNLRQGIVAGVGDAYKFAWHRLRRRTVFRLEKEDHDAGRSASSDAVTATASDGSLFCFFFLGNLGCGFSGASERFSSISTP